MSSASEAGMAKTHSSISPATAGLRKVTTMTSTTSATTPSPRQTRACKAGSAGTGGTPVRTSSPALASWSPSSPMAAGPGRTPSTAWSQNSAVKISSRPISCASPVSASRRRNRRPNAPTAATPTTVSTAGNIHRPSASTPANAAAEHSTASAPAAVATSDVSMRARFAVTSQPPSPARWFPGRAAARPPRSRSGGRPR